VKHFSFALFCGVALAACSEQGFGTVKDYGGVYESTLSGRVCDANSGRWLEGATVYTHIINDAGELIDTRETLSADDGTWELDELRGGQTYTVYVQYGNEIIDMFDIDVGDSADVEVPTPACDAELGRVAVITGHYDDWESVLSTVGIGNYDIVDGLSGSELGQFLSDPANLAEYGALFFAGGHVEEDVLYDTDGSDTDGTVEAVKEAVKGFVSAGGTVYASDWSYNLMELCWPNKIEFLGDDDVPDAAQLGEPDEFRANIVDHDLAAAVGHDGRNVVFDLDTWPVMVSVDDGVTVYERADTVKYREGTQESTKEDVPLLVGFDVDDGRVVFSSWRVAANLDGLGPDVLKYVLEQ
jgi:hypothetical protein